jgi:hypothetical protein
MIVQELGRPLAVIDQIVECDRFTGRHETRIITSGPQAYAASLSGIAASTASRFSTLVQVECRVPCGPDQEPCGGIAEVDLAAPGVWEASADAIALLTRYGTAVEA